MLVYPLIYYLVPLISLEAALYIVSLPFCSGRRLVPVGFPCFFGLSGYLTLVSSSS